MNIMPNIFNNISVEFSKKNIENCHILANFVIVNNFMLYCIINCNFLQMHTHNYNKIK